MNPTSEQDAILAAAVDTKANLCISALAGTGKSSTLRMIERVVRQKPILYLAFNKKIVDDICYKHNPKDPADAAKRMSSTTTVKTLNGLGHGIWGATIGQNLALDFKKSQGIFKEVIDELPKAHRSAAWEVYWPVLEGVSLAKALGHVPEGKFPNAKRLITPESFHASLEERPDDLTADLIDLVLFRSIQAAYKGKIDFNDQVYMPAVFGGRYPQFPLVLVDEAQDLNPVNHEILSRLVRGRCIIVGDPQQSIYGFRGAVQSGMEALGTRFQTSPLDLSISFRCPQAIVEAARWRVPTFKWIKEGGHVENLVNLEGLGFPESATILCRNNAPLFGLAFRLLSAGRSVNVAGSDIGPKLLGILRRLGDESLSRPSALGLVDDWLTQKVEKGSRTAPDMAACMRVFLEHGDSLGQAIRYAEHLFAQTGTIRLMTGHKAKGLEFDTVYFLDDFLCRDDEQDQNLRYVIQTRSMNSLYYINSAAIQW